MLPHLTRSGCTTRPCNAWRSHAASSFIRISPDCLTNLHQHGSPPQEPPHPFRHPTHRHSRFLHAESLCGTDRSRVILDSLFVFQKRESRITLRSEVFSTGSLFFHT